MYTYISLQKMSYLLATIKNYIVCEYALCTYFLLVFCSRNIARFILFVYSIVAGDLHSENKKLKAKLKQYTDLHDTIKGLDDITKRLLDVEKQRQEIPAASSSVTAVEDPLEAMFSSNKASGIPLSKTVRQALNQIFTKAGLLTSSTKGEGDRKCLDEAKVQRLQILASRHFNAPAVRVNAIIAQKCVDERAGESMLIDSNSI